MKMQKFIKKLCAAMGVMLALATSPFLSQVRADTILISEGFKHVYSEDNQGAYRIETTELNSNMVVAAGEFVPRKSTVTLKKWSEDLYIAVAFISHACKKIKEEKPGNEIFLKILKTGNPLTLIGNLLTYLEEKMGFELLAHAEEVVLMERA